eukprot:SM000281S10754  [mRNA]  locus=s281:108583:112559:- [translate_table: standard]
MAAPSTAAAAATVPAEAPAAADDAGAPALAKTTLCSYHRRGACRHGDACRYAHGEAELRPRPDGSWDPTSAKAAAGSGSGGAECGTPGPPPEAAGAAAEAASEGSAQLCIKDLPSAWKTADLASLLAALGVPHVAAKKRPGMVNGFLQVAGPADALRATELLEGKRVQKRRLSVAPALPRAWERLAPAAKPGDDAAADSSDGGEEGVGGGELGAQKAVKAVRTASEAVTPLAHLAYAEQLALKDATIRQALKKIVRKTRKCCPRGTKLPDWVCAARERGCRCPWLQHAWVEHNCSGGNGCGSSSVYGLAGGSAKNETLTGLERSNHVSTEGLPCEVLDILESPQVDEYRNKCEFTVGRTVAGAIEVGFQLGMFREGVTAVEEPSSCRNVSRVAKAYAASMRSIVEASALPVWDKKENKGFWRQLTVREGGCPSIEEAIDVMLLVQIGAEQFPQEVVDAELRSMAAAFVKGAATACPPLPLTTIICQLHAGVSNAAPPSSSLVSLKLSKQSSAGGRENGEVLEIEGPLYIQEQLCGLSFRISPTAFFQVNTRAAEKLYRLVGEWAELGPNTLLFDVCCGTGTIGLTLAAQVGMVVGIEMNEAAVMDARTNASINGITNCRFVAAKAEDVMQELLMEYSEQLETAPGKGEACDVTADPSNKKLKTQAAVDQEDRAQPDEGRAEGAAVEDKEEAPYNSCSDSPQHRFSEVVAIVDPPRVGLHPTVLKSLRSHPQLKRLVYVSCNPESLAMNALELCTPYHEQMGQQTGRRPPGQRGYTLGTAKRRLGGMSAEVDAFRPERAIAVDLFPHTPHCELVLLLQR